MTINYMVSESMTNVFAPAAKQATMPVSGVSIKNTEESLKTFMPYLTNQLIGQFQMMFPSFTKIDDRSQKLLNDRISGASFTASRIEGPIVNAMTIPGLTDKRLSSFMSIPIAQFLLAYQMVDQTNKTIKPTAGRNGKVVLKCSYPKAHIFSWSTAGLGGIVNDDELMAIHLHEIGHWAYVKAPVYSTVAKMLMKIIPAFSVPLYVLGLYYGRLGEYQADNFAKACGYGQPLQKSLIKLGYRQRTNISILGKLDDLLNLCMTKIMNFTDNIIPISTHPSMRNRVSALRESDEYIQEALTEKIVPFARTVFSPVDRLLAKHAGALDPYGN